MKIRSFLILCLLLISTYSWSESKWLSYGNGMINLDNVSSIIPGTTTHKEIYEGTVLGNFYKGTILDVMIPSDRCNSGYTWTYRGWVDFAKGDPEYLGLYSTEKHTYEQNLKVLDISSDEQVEMENLMRDMDIKPETNTLLSSYDGWSDITSYDTFMNWYTYKNPLSIDRELLKTRLSSIPLELLDTEEGFEELKSTMSSILPVTEVGYTKWLSSDNHVNKIIEDTYNLNDHYLSNTVPMYHNSIKFDEFELWISGTSCDFNLVSSESESKKLIQDTLSKIGTFINIIR